MKNLPPCGEAKKRHKLLQQEAEVDRLAVAYPPGSINPK